MTFSIVLLFLSLGSFGWKAGDASLRYTPVTIPVRDGHFLAADLYYAGETPLPKPAILIQTPYDKNYYRTGTVPGQGGGKSFPKDERYNYVVLDWRGFYGSQAAAVPGYDRGLDGYDAVEWVAAQSWCDGRVGTWGSSALGQIQYLTARHHPPHLKCCTIQVKDFLNQYSNYYYGGDYRKEHVQCLELLGFLPASLILAHPAEDEFWQAAAQNSVAASEIGVPVLVVGGWYDHFPSEVLRGYEDLRRESHPSIRDSHKLVFGPWTHGGVGENSQGILNYPYSTDIYSEEIDFWNYYLLGVQNGWTERPAVQYYQMGEDAWFSSHTWEDIPRSETVLYLHQNNLLSESLPPEDVEPARFSYDPDDPTPALGGSRFNPFNPSVLVGPQDLGPVEARSDVLVYSTPLLSKDLRVNGSLRAELYVSSDRTDTDFCVRLTDVFPDGRSIIVTQGIRRMRFRNGYEREEPMAPGTVYPVAVELQDLALTFRAGHRLRIVVCSADYPHFDKNRNDGGPMYSQGPSYVASNAVYQDACYPSRLVLETLPTEALLADFSWNPEHPTAGESVSLTASVSGGTPPYTCAWDLAGIPAKGTSVEASFEAGAHVLLLTVRDGAGGEVLAEKDIQVGEPLIVRGVAIRSNPFRLDVSGEGFQPGCRVEVDDAAAPRTIFKSSARVIAKGDGLKGQVPKSTPVSLVVVNPDGTRSSPYTVLR